MLGGFELHPFKREISLSNSVFCTFGAGGGGEQDAFLDLHHAHQRAFEIDPDSFAELEQTWETEDTGSFRGKVMFGQILSLLELSSQDADVLRAFSHILIKNVHLATKEQRAQLCSMFPRILKNNYALSPWDDSHFQIGRLYHKMSEYEKALEQYELSEAFHGVHHATLYNLGICYYKQGELAQASGCFREAIHMKPDYKKALRWRAKLEKEGVQEGMSRRAQKAQWEDTRPQTWKKRRVPLGDRGSVTVKDVTSLARQLCNTGIVDNMMGPPKPRDLRLHDIVQYHDIVPAS